MVSLPISVVLIVASFYTESRLATWILRIAAMPGLFAFGGMVLQFAVFPAAECRGDVLSGLYCSKEFHASWVFTLMRVAAAFWVYGTVGAFAAVLIGPALAVFFEINKRNGL